MLKLRSFTLSNCGWKNAFFEGDTLRFTDAGGIATDTVMHAANGNGKTSALALFFSCFDTDLDRFMRTMVNRNYRFKDYFPAREPALIASEWTDGKRRAVIGQMVLPKPEDGLDRIFFAFWGDRKFGIGDLPFTGLGRDYAGRMRTRDEALAWIRGAADKYQDSHEFWRTDRQAAWKERLPGYGIDPQLLAWMVDLNKTEGGIAKLLDFPSEAAFLAKFLEMTLPQRAADDMRDNLRAKMDSLASAAREKAALGATEALHAGASAFAGSADALVSARQETAKAGARHAGLRAALLRETTRLNGLATDAAERRDTAAREADGFGAARAQAGMDAGAAQAALAQADADDAEAAAAEAERLDRDAKALHALLEAADGYRPIGSLDAGIATLQEQMAAANDGLAGPERIARQAGDEFAAALAAAAAAAEQSAAEAEAAHRLAAEQAASAGTRARQAEDRLQEAGRQAGALDSSLQAAERALQRLLASGAVTPGETVMAARARHQAARETASAEGSQAQRQAREDTETAERQREIAAGQRGKGTESRAQAKAAQKRLDDAARQRNAVLRLDVIASVTGDDSFDPESPAVPRALRAEERRCRDASLDASLRIRTLGTDAASIERHGLAAVGTSVDAVVDRLRAAGIADAMPYAVWLARQGVPPDEIRAMSGADPAMVSGVWVPGPDALEKARAIAETDLGLAHPVACGSAVAGPAVPQANRVVFAVARPGAYGLAAAAAQMANVHEAIARLRNESAAADSREQACGHAARLVEAWTADWGGGVLDAASATLVLAAAAADQADAGAAGHAAEAATASDRAKSATARAAEAARRNVDATVLENRIATYVAEHETKLPAIRQDLAQANRDLGASAASRDAAREENAEALGRMRAEQAKIAEARRTAGALSAELLGIAMRDGGTTPREVPLEQARAACGEALATLEKLRDGEAKSVAARLKDMRRHRQDMVGRLVSRFGAITEGMVQASCHADLTVRRERAALDSDAAAKRVGEANGRSGSAGRTAREKQSALPPGGRDLYDSLIGSDRGVLEAMATDGAERHDQAARGQEEAVQRRNGAAEEYRQHEIRRSRIAGVAKSVLPGSAEAEDVELEAVIERIEDQASQANADLKAAESAGHATLVKAEAAYRSMNRLALSPGIADAHPQLSRTMAEQTFEAAAANPAAIVRSLWAQIEIRRNALAQQRAHGEMIIDQLEALANSAIASLRRACKAAVPPGVPRLGGLAVLKPGVDLGKVPVETRREVARSWLDAQVAIRRVPEKGHQIAAELLRAMTASQGKETIGLRILKPTDAGEVEYTAVAAMAASGGETLTAALLLWVCLTKLRAETVADSKLAAGGALILDNPIGTANHQLFLRTQRAIAAAMQVQLIFTTGVEDLNAIAEFPHVLKFGKAGERGGRMIVRVAAEHIGEPRDDYPAPDQSDLFGDAA
jgi:hypothetical protein